MTGDVTGGKLKTPADADSESLQAKWIAGNLKAELPFPVSAYIKCFFYITIPIP